MNRTQKTLRNSAVSLTGQIISILLGFISRKVFIQYFGVELLGLNSTFASLLSTLSLADLGFHKVIVFHLYGALAKHDEEKINDLVNIYKLVYRCIGIFFIVASLCCVPFLQYVLSDIEVTPIVRIFFLIQAMTSACTYFLAYKRNILYADQNSYLSGLIDMAVNSAAMVVCILVAIFTRNYVLYLLIQLARTYLSNLLVHRECSKRYPFLHSVRVDWALLKKMVRDIKNVVIERLAGYIYSSTDNLIISAFISTVQVGFLNNYTMIIAQIRTLVNSLLTPLIPALGNSIAAGENSHRQVEVFRLIQQGDFWLTGLTIVPIFILSDCFVEMFYGAAYVLPRIILFLMCMDLYMHIMQEACLSFLTANGIFRKRRNISIGGAIVNIVVSLLLMKPFGIAGILAGTAVSQVYYWVARSVVALRDCLKQDWKALADYWLRQAGLLGIVVAAIAVSQIITRQVFVVNGIITFIVNGVICEVCFCLFALICCRGIRAQHQLEIIALGMLRKVIHKLTR